ncbi:MAG: glycosyltransferase [Rhodothermales bacterium]|nr:glycosyltransferase [Rhodothermales bacterium]
MSDALAVFAKQPIAGRVKTRLQTLLDAAGAAEMYRAFLVDSVHQYISLNKRIYLYLDRHSADQSIVRELPDVDVRYQLGADLSERMRNASLDMFAAGHERCAIIGTDHPSLPLPFIQEAFNSLVDPMSMTIGPSEDGGYYLVGMNDFFPALFDGMTFSHERVFGDTLDRAVASSASVTVLPIWYDVDTPDQLPRLYVDLLADPLQAPRTLALLEKLASQHAWTRSV